jgi:hypothetical protein
MLLAKKVAVSQDFLCAHLTIAVAVAVETLPRYAVLIENVVVEMTDDGVRGVAPGMIAFEFEAVERLDRRAHRQSDGWIAGQVDPPGPHDDVVAGGKFQAIAEEIQ